MSDLEAVVGQMIAHYQATSKSKQLKLLVPKNERRIADRLRQRKQERKLTELVRKWTHYNLKICELLAHAAEPTQEEVSDDADAEHFIKHTVLKLRDTRAKIAALIFKHKVFQEEMARQLVQVRGRGWGRGEQVGFAKLARVNAEQKQALAAALEKAVAEFCEKVARQQAEYARDSERELAAMGVPFFGDRAAKERVLALLYKHCQ